jgi:uncharacterized protein (DUF1778 family)
MSSRDTLTFSQTLRFRSLAGDREIIEAAASKDGLTMSAFIRDAVIAEALKRLRCRTREGALKSLQIARPARRRI